MAPTRRTNRETSRVPGGNPPVSGLDGSPPNGPQPNIVFSQEELARIIAEAVEKALENKAPCHHSAQPEQEHEQEQEEREDGMREMERESSAGSKSPTVAEELEELRRKVKVLEGQVGSKSNTRTIIKSCPFSDGIVQEPLPGNFKFANIKDYDGSSDPEEHLARFENMAILHCYGDKIKCKVFLTTLVDSAQRWFEGLASQSIHSFEDFQNVFLHQFSSSKK